MEDRWKEFDLLIRELGGVRRFTDEAGRLSLQQTPEVQAVTHALDTASRAVSRLTRDENEALVLEAWRAIARAQDAVSHARAVVLAARRARESARALREHALVQRTRAAVHHEAIARQAARVRASAHAARPEPGEAHRPLLPPEGAEGAKED